MKKIFSLLMGMAFVLAFGLVYAEDSMTETKDTNDKMIRNDDLLHLKLDPDRATVNQMPSELSAEGSAAGGIQSEPDSMGTDIEQGKAPVDKGAAEPGAEGSSAGGVSKDSDTKIDQGGKAPVDKAPAGPGTEGSGAGGESKDTDSYR